MPSGNSKKWFAGSLFILALAMMPPMAMAADEVLGSAVPGGLAPSTAVPSGDMLGQPPAQAMPQGIPDESKVPGIQGDSKIQPVPENSVTPDANPSTPANAEECGSFCGSPLCSPSGRFWLRTDALLWWTNGSHLPPLVTSNSSGNLPIIGQPGTTIVFGDQNYLDGVRGGAQIRLGGWLDRCHRWGLEADWLSVGGLSVDYSNTSNGTPAVGRPYFDVEPVAIAPVSPATTSSGGHAIGQNASFIAVNFLQDPEDLINFTGTVTVHAADSFNGAGLLARYNLCCGDCCNDPCGGADDCNNCANLCMNYCRTDFLIGYRQYTYSNGLIITENTNDFSRNPDPLNPSTPVNINTQITDNFRTRNLFNGAELGLNTELRRGRWSLNILTKMAFGNNRQTTDINGTTTLTHIGGAPNPLNFPVGRYALATNSGSYAQDSFVIIPNLGLELGYQLTGYTRAYLGYNILYWGNVMRAGDQIDQNIDERNFANAPFAENALPFPQFPNHSSPLIVQGINLGLEVRF